MKTNATKLLSDIPSVFRNIPGIMITLRSARENLYLTYQQVSEKTGIPVKRILNLEIDCTKAKMEEFVRLIKLYGLSSSHVFVGRETDAFLAIECYLNNQQKSPSSRQEPKVIS